MDACKHSLRELAHRPHGALLLRFFSILSLYLLQVTSLGTVYANDEVAALKESFITGCKTSMLKQAVIEYAAFGGKKAEDIRPETEGKIKDFIEPISGTCDCVAEKISIKIKREGEKDLQFSIDTSALTTPRECLPEPTVAMQVQRNLWKFHATSPPSQKLLQTKRAPFVIDTPVTNGQPSLFASISPPPETTPQVVLLPLGTGSACPPDNACLADAPLTLIPAETLLSEERRFLGEQGAQNLKQMMDTLGSDMPVVTSGRNYTNFAPSPTAQGAFEYRIRYIDGVPIEQTRIKQLWLTVFVRAVPTDPRAAALLPARVAVMKIEFQDE